MIPESIQEQTIYLYNHLAKNIEWGFNDIDTITDPRGGLISPLIWVKKHIKEKLKALMKVMQII